MAILVADSQYAMLDMHAPKRRLNMAWGGRTVPGGPEPFCRLLPKNDKEGRLIIAADEDPRAFDNDGSFEMLNECRDALHNALGVLRIEKKGLTVITDTAGRPVQYRTVAEEMRKVKALMEHPEASKYVTHGLRKNATIELYEACGDDELVKAVTGHSSIEMLKRYGGQVRQRVLAAQAQDARNRMERNKTET